MKIKQSVINTFNRVQIPFGLYLDRTDKVKVANWMTQEECETHPLLAHCIHWVYETQMSYENGDHRVKVSDFDRVRYFVLEQDRNAYMTCLD